MSSVEAPIPEPSPVAWRPWRSAGLGWGVTASVLVAGLPLYFCMPLGVDTTLYDMAARAVLRGGTHYRDVFDTNLPGIVWAMSAIRVTLGWGTQALRACDLLIVLTCVGVLCRWVRQCGGSAASVAWFAAGVSLFYPFTSQFAHCQRDTWMLLPAVAAVGIRLARFGPAPDGSVPTSRGPLWRGSVIEGVCWGLAVWVKPHVLIPGVAVCGVSLLPLLRLKAGQKLAVRDVLGTSIGGLIVGGVGGGWLVWSGTWPHLADVLANWNPEYADRVLGQFSDRIGLVLEYFPPWSLGHLIAIPIAVAGVLEYRAYPQRPTWVGRSWTIRWHTPAATGREALTRAVLGVLYLGWLFQAWVFQMQYDYIHVPEMFLMMAVVAGQGWALGFSGAVWLLACTVFMRSVGTERNVFELVVALEESPIPLKVPNHPLGRPGLSGVWVRTWREGPTPSVRDAVQQLDDMPYSTAWEELERVAHFLRASEPPLADRELLCWHDGTHPLYLMTGVEPAARYMHWNTAFQFRSKADRLSREVAQTPHRFVVSDFQHLLGNKTTARASGLDGSECSLPYCFPRSQFNRYPWNQPVVFRAGRYAVHRIDHPIRAGEVEPPLWQHARAVLRPGINAWSGWAGKTPDPTLIGPAHREDQGPGTVLVLDTLASWDQLNKALGFDRKPPAVDFTRFVAVVGMSGGEQMALSAVPQQGSLGVAVESARRQAPGVRYQIVVLPRDGIETVNGQPLRPPPTVTP